ncbi:MAG TPA: CarD family transcriptional regulator [Xanthomonadales bacterium]|nr:CarD family transcriptional regulator [Xanthomonadales bacterium]
MFSNPRRRFITAIQGDRIHHPHHGIGKIESIRKRSFSGENGSKFAKIFFERDCVTLMVRENQLDETCRKPIGPTEAKKLLAHLKTWKGKVSNQWKTRANANQLKMDEGNPNGYAEVYKGLKVREEDGSLSAADRVHLKQAGEFLAEELAIALGKTPSEALDKISSASSQA